MTFIHPFSVRNTTPQEYKLQLGFDLPLESGEILKHPVIAFQVWGEPDAQRSNIVWVCHALTGNHRVHEWWGGLFGTGKCFDPEVHCIVSVNVPGSCYGSEGPLSFCGPGKRYYRSFPQITVRDMVQVLDQVRVWLGIERIGILIGASLGGQQVLEWSVWQPELFGSIIPIAANLRHSPYGIAFNEAQRLAIAADPTFEAGEYNGGRNGLIAARSIAMLSYRTYEGYAKTQTDEDTSLTDHFKAASYQRYQGEKLAARFNACSYWLLSKAMDSHNLERGRKPVEELLAQVRIPALVIGIDSDLLFPLKEQQRMAALLPMAEMAVLSSDFGHDGFLVEYQQLSDAINSFLKTIGRHAQPDERLESYNETGK